MPLFAHGVDGLIMLTHYCDFGFPQLRTLKDFQSTIVWYLF